MKFYERVVRFRLRGICALVIVASVSAPRYSKQINIEELSDRDLCIEMMTYILISDEARGGF